MMAKRQQNKILPEIYFLPRDFELVQPLYNLAFLLEVVSVFKNQPPPKYRVFSLYQAAHGLDSYTSSICMWLDGQFSDEEMSTVPSPRIRQYLQEIRTTGALAELSALSQEKSAIGCLRLRSIRGLNFKNIARLFGKSKPSKNVIAALAQRSGRTTEEIEAVFRGRDYLHWQAAHVLPPLFRFLKQLESSITDEVSYATDTIDNGVHPIIRQFVVFANMDNETLKKAVRRTVKTDPLFKVVASKDSVFTIEHLMGWSFEVRPDTPKDSPLIFKSLRSMIAELDPLASDFPKWLKADLHSHTYWSDGIASPETMSRAIATSGLEYFAVTDHSRSSKLQNGLGISDWLKQEFSFRQSAFESNVLHGLEVDILQDGSLDLPGRFLQTLDLVVASVHSTWSKHEAENTRRLIRAVESGRVDVLGHPSAAMLGKPGIPSYRREGPPVDWKQIIDCCAQWKVALEINCFPSRLDISGSLLDHAISAGCWISLGSDAHSPYHLPLLKFAPAVLAQSKAGSPQILNKMSVDQLTDWLAAAREYRRGLSKTDAIPVQGDLFGTLGLHNSAKSVKVRIAKSLALPKGALVIGMDLVASEEKKTGVAILSESNVAETLSLKTDAELVALVEARRPAIVSIDSPLGLPGGGEKVNPDAGIVRMAEYHLAAVGIPAYPALIDSMENLTLRGVRIANLLRQLPYKPTVIESYPGSAQDILGIPRKQRGLNLLREGLARVGVSGPGLETPSHDELDAITSALVGRFYETGHYEAMGVPKEAQLIVPISPNISFEKRFVISMTGKNGSGKSVVSRYLALFYGFKWIKTRDIIRQLIVDDFDGMVTKHFGWGMLERDDISDEQLGAFGTMVLNQYGQAPLRARLKDVILSETGPVVVDAIRSDKDTKGLDLGDTVAKTWFVHCADRLIEQRCRERGDRKNKPLLMSVSMDKNIEQFRRNASTVISNNDSLEHLRRTVDDALFEHLEVAK